MRHMLIETESTPNPATLKFLPGRAVMEAGTRDFASPEEAEASPLATALFTLGDVTGVFFGRDFISVTIAPGAEWADAKPDVLGIVMDHFLADMPLFHPATAAGISVPAEGESGFADDPADADIIDQIKELIETRVRPRSRTTAATSSIAASTRAMSISRCRAPAPAARRRLRRSKMASSRS